MTAAVALVLWLVSVAMILNGFRWWFRGAGDHLVLRERGETPGWEPKQPQLIHGLWCAGGFAVVGLAAVIHST